MSKSGLQKWLVLACVFVTTCFCSLFAQAVSESEKQIRAMFVYNFANFVEWPTRAFENNKDQLQICLLGDVVFQPYLMPMAGTLIGDKSLVISNHQDAKNFEGQCHIMFVGDDQKVNLKKLTKTRKYYYILSVSEQDEFIEKGGIVHIVDQIERISFDIDLDRARKRGLFISSDLLSLARNIQKLTD